LSAFLVTLSLFKFKKTTSARIAVMPQKLLPMGDQKAGMLQGLAADGKIQETQLI